ncbi:MAG: hypothetical protein ABEK59_00460 [Halobacteria archaeon]
MLGSVSGALNLVKVKSNEENGFTGRYRWENEYVKVLERGTGADSMYDLGGSGRFTDCLDVRENLTGGD